jgi:hypothetical protein
LDVHKETIAVAVARAGRGEPEYHGEVPHTAQGIAKLLKQLSPQGEVLDVCYEAGPCGYGLYRDLVGRGHRCTVVAPALIPRKAGVRLKTDRRDALLLARLHRAGELTAVWVPALGYGDWERIVLSWGNVVLQDEGERPTSNLAALVQSLRRVGEADWSSFSKRPRSRIILSLATALPKVRREVLRDPVCFPDRLDDVSRRDPGQAYEAAYRFGDGILQMGTSLVCNFFKEPGLLYYVKVDVHVGDFIDELEPTRALGAKQRFVLSWLLAREARMASFVLDKILYVGGKYCKPALRSLFQSRRSAYEREVRRLIEEIPAYA